MSEQLNFLLLIAPLLPLISSCSSSGKLDHLHGKTEAEVYSLLGKPDSIEKMTLMQGTTLPELYIEIHNTYHPDEPSSDGVVIKEFRYDLIGKNKALFLHKVDDQWLVLESAWWKDEVAF